MESVSRFAKFLRRSLRRYDDSYMMGLIGAMSKVPDISKLDRLYKGPFPEITPVVISWADQEFMTWTGALMLGEPVKKSGRVFSSVAI